MFVILNYNYFGNIEQRLDVGPARLNKYNAGPLIYCQLVSVQYCQAIPVKKPASILNVSCMIKTYTACELHVN